LKKIAQKITVAAIGYAVDAESNEVTSDDIKMAIRKVGKRRIRLFASGVLGALAIMQITLVFVPSLPSTYASAYEVSLMILPITTLIALVISHKDIDII
jgi:hypothetical protein